MNFQVILDFPNFHFHVVLWAKKQTLSSTHMYTHCIRIPSFLLCFPMSAYQYLTGYKCNLFVFPLLPLFPLEYKLLTSKGGCWHYSCCCYQLDVLYVISLGLPTSSIKEVKAWCWIPQFHFSLPFTTKSVAVSPGLLVRFLHRALAWNSGLMLSLQCLLGKDRRNSTSLFLSATSWM